MENAEINKILTNQEVINKIEKIGSLYLAVLYSEIVKQMVKDKEFNCLKELKYYMASFSIGSLLFFGSDARKIALQSISDIYSELIKN